MLLLIKQLHRIIYHLHLHIKTMFDCSKLLGKNSMKCFKIFTCGLKILAGAKPPLGFRHFPILSE